MKYNRFEELPVWQDTIALAVRIYELSDDGAFKRRYSLRNQLEEAEDARARQEFLEELEEIKFEKR